jgi:CRISPR-associated endonuclease/helicase Cas3
MMTFEKFFKVATAHSNGSYDYQCRLACGERTAGEPPQDWLSHGTDCESHLINIPTGLGKTAAVVLAWLWNRVLAQNPAWPRRLVYCLPMRTLVEQTQGEVEKWLENLVTKAGELGIEGQAKAELQWLAEHSPIILMGGEELNETKRDWDTHPERSAILIGTQDMLLSRALNRGYGMSRYRWPMHFGLLNNDCLWVMDETQLMGVGVETSAQLEGFRSSWSKLAGSPTWWMSATLDEARLDTVDHPKPKPPGAWPRLELGEEERAAGRPKDLFEAKKSISQCPVTLSATTKDDYAKQLADLILTHHQTFLQSPYPSGTLTLVVLNRVSRARQVYEALAGGKKPLYDPQKVALIHSRFRRADRERHTRLLLGQGDRIVIATQAVEAGVDVSARLLVTELAPWASLVQRIGRCNRRADMPDAKVIWVDIEPDTKGELLLPYTQDELAKAQSAIRQLTNASPRALRGIEVREKPVVRPVIRRRDLVDLFDTTPDLCGQDLDISRYIRDGKDSDVQFFWRNIAGGAPIDNEPPPLRDELCRVSIGEATKFLDKKTTHAWRWNPLTEQWVETKAARPGNVYLVDANNGGYCDDLGWTGEPKDKPTPHPPKDGIPESYADNCLAFAREWQPMAEHTKLVVQSTEVLTSELGLVSTLASALKTAALWHDLGKAHAVFQKALLDGPHRPPDEKALYAKSKNPPKPGAFPAERRGFRHELASALAWLIAGPTEAAERDLVTYLVAAHHGKVRLSIRSLPDEKGNPKRPNAFFARGLWQDDPLPAVPLGEITTPPVALDLSFMQMGEGKYGPSWLARTVALRDRLGSFQLAFLETILRAADARASKGQAHPASSDTPYGMELHEPSPYSGTTALSPEEESLVAELVADGLNIQKKFRPEPLYKQTGKGHYEGGTVEEIRRAKEKGTQGDKS